MKIDTTNGVLDSSFGSDDGSDGDGIIQVNNFLSYDASSNDETSDLLIEGSRVYLVGDTTGDLGGPASGSEDAFVIKLDTDQGRLDQDFGDED